MTDYIIRTETENDYRAVENLTREAFWNVYVPGCSEHYFVHTMRSHEDFIPELAFVVELDGKIIGSIMYYRTSLTDENGNKKEILSFGPLGILPAYQRQGLGKALMKHSFARAKEMGYDAIVILGSPSNYVSSGFRS
ncbi:MAG: N-acetyltransferase, partial [Clostridia bacterium]|nr:N-acetyltransferase [Clostridia bacterium]